MNDQYLFGAHAQLDIGITAALIELDKTLRIKLDGTDPTPWFNAECDIFGRNPFDVKIAMLSRKIFVTALLNGSLSGRFSHGANSPIVPGWAWAAPTYVGHCLIDGHLRLSPLLPDEWQELTCKPVFIDRSEFTSWLQGLVPVPCDSEPLLPPPFDADDRPRIVSAREPVKTSWVSLAQAASWVAFYVSLGGYELELIIDADETSALVDPRYSDLEQGLAALLDAGSGLQPLVVFAGRYAAHYYGGKYKADSELIEPQKLRNFGQPDWLRNGLLWGPPSPHHPGSGYDRLWEDRRDGFQDVHVEWTGLMATFPPRAHVPIVRAKHDEVISWCRNWLADPKTGNGETPAWKVFQHIARFKGHSREDSFRPAWREAKTTK